MDDCGTSPDVVADGWRTLAVTAATKQRASKGLNDGAAPYVRLEGLVGQWR